MPPILDEVKAFDILLCQSKYEELKEEFNRKMLLKSYEATEILKDVAKMLNNLESNIKSSLEDGCCPLDSIQNLRNIKSTKIKLDGLNSLLKFKEILSKLDERFVEINGRLTDAIRHEHYRQANDSLKSAQKNVNKLERWIFWIREFCFLNSICGSVNLRRVKKDLQAGHAHILKLKGNMIQPNFLDLELDFSTAEYYLQNMVKKLPGERGIIKDLKSELTRVKDHFNGIRKQLKEEEKLEIEYIDAKSEFRAKKEQILSWRHIMINILLCLVAISVGLHQFLYSNKSAKTTDSVIAPLLPVRHNVSAHVALVPPPKEYNREKDTVLLLNSEEDISFSSIQHVEDVTLLKNGLKIAHSGVYEVYYSIHIRPQENETCALFENKPFKSYMLRTNPQSIKDVLLLNSHMCCSNCAATEETKYSSAVFKLNVGDVVQVMWSSKKIPVYFNRQSSFLGLSMR